MQSYNPHALSCDDIQQLKLGTVLALRLVGLSLPQAMRLRCVCLHIHSTVTLCFNMHSINEHMEHLNCTLCALFSVNTANMAVHRLPSATHAYHAYFAEPADDVNGAIPPEHVNA